MRKLPLHELHSSLGATWGDWADSEWPDHYKDAVQEHLATRERAGLFDWTALREVQIRGEEALAFAGELLTNRVDDLLLGQVRYSPMIDDKGGVIDDTTLYLLAPGHLHLIYGLGTDLPWIMEQAKRFKVEVREVSDDRVMPSLQGPRALDILQRLTTANLGALRYYHFTHATVAGISEARIARIGYHGERGYEVSVPTEHGEKLFSAILEAGQPDGIMPCGMATVDTLRMEKGFYLPDTDFTPELNAVEARFTWACDFNKRSFSGKDALERVQEEGPKRQLVHFKVEGDTVPQLDDAVSLDGKRVGRVTSACACPSVGAVLGFAQVATPASSEGTLLEVDRGGSKMSVRLVRKPVFDPENRRPRGIYD
jgi:aminomethyltransferase